MSTITICILLAVGSYLLGSFSSSIAISLGKSKGDIRKLGSGNAGATNMARIYGMAAGVVTMTIDLLKALICAEVGYQLLGDIGLAVAGFSSMVGHCYPIYYHFKGGKGISVGAGLAIAIHWKVFLALAVVFFVTALPTKKVSVGSVCAAVGLTVASLLLHVSTPKLVMAVCATVLAIFQHRANIRRLLNGTEPDFKAAHKE